MNINWDKIKSVNGFGHKIPSKMEELFSDSPEKSNSAKMWIELEIIHAGLLFEAAFYTIDLLIEALQRENIYSKYYAFSLLFQLCLAESDEEIITNYGNTEKINLTLACRQKIKSYLKNIKEIPVENEPIAQENKNDVIEIIESWDDKYSNDKYFEEE